MECKPAITTVSLGSFISHSITEKIDQAAGHGFKGIELFIDDLEALARDNYSPPGTSEPSYDAIMDAATQVRQQCDKLDIEILNLQPLRFYEGLVDRKSRDHILNDTLPIWMDALKILGADTILVPSNFLSPDPETKLPRTTGDLQVIVDDLRELATRGAQREPPIKFAYEALAWGTHVNTWEKTWEIVQAVDRPNLGLALDTFNIAGAIYADPTEDNGCVGGCSNGADEIVRASLGRMVKTIDLSKLFIVQIADAERLTQPLRPGHPYYNEEQPSRLSWSRNCRLFLCEDDRGGFLPVIEILQTILDLGWTGYLAYELFSRTLLDSDPRTPAQHAERAQRSWERLSFIEQQRKDRTAANGIKASAAGLEEKTGNETESKTPDRRSRWSCVIM